MGHPKTIHTNAGKGGEGKGESAKCNALQPSADDQVQVEYRLRIDKDSAKVVVDAERVSSFEELVSGIARGALLPSISAAQFLQGSVAYEGQGTIFHRLVAGDHAQASELPFHFHPFSSILQLEV